MNVYFFKKTSNLTNLDKSFPTIMIRKMFEDFPRFNVLTFSINFTEAYSKTDFQKKVIHTLMTYFFK